MRKRRHSEAQIAAILKELDAGRPAVELARKHGVHVNTLRLWRSKYGGLDVRDLSRLKELESENSERNGSLHDKHSNFVRCPR
jgi:putative transposase